MTCLLPYSPWLVWIIPSLASLLVPLAAKINGKIRNYFVISASLLTIIFAVSMMPDVYFGATQIVTDVTVPWIPVTGGQAGVLVDPLSTLFANLIAFLGFVVLVYSLDYMAHEEGLTRYYFLMLLFIGAMIGLVMADNFLLMFVFWEVVGVCSYALVSFWYKQSEACNAGIKVFLMTRVGDVCLLAAILILYVNLHTFSFRTIINLVQEGKVALPILSLASFLTLIGAIAKSAQLPLHTWLYGAMEAPTSVSCLLHGATMVKGGVYLIARTLVIFYAVPMWTTTVAWIGVITAVVGATLALETPDIKGVPAYSTISQIGFMFAALGASSSPQSPGWFASLFHLLSHACFQGLGFLAIGSIVHQLGTRDMRKMGGLRRSMPITFALCLVVILARSGIPPFCSFFSKGLIASTIWSTGDLALVFLIYAAAALTFAYSLRFLVITFAGKESDYIRKVHVHEAPALMVASSGVLAVLCVVLGFFEPFLIRFMHVPLEFNMSSFVSLESLMFLVVLFVGGFPIYLVYMRKSLSADKLRKGILSPVGKVLGNGYYFDFVYDNFLVNSVTKFSRGIHRYVEVAGLERLPYLIAGGAMHLAQGVYNYVDSFLDRLCYLVAGHTMIVAKGTHKHLDTFLDELCYIFAGRVMLHGSRIKKMHTGALPHFVVAAVFGFFILCILLLLTMSW
jgi:NADH-quinone oxidoreductase subunit L